MKSILSKIFIITALTQIFPIGKSLAQEIYVVANVSIGNPKVSIEDVRALYLNNRMINAIDISLTPIDCPDTQELKDVFYKRIANLSRIELKRHWSRAIFTGKGIPPIVIQREDLIESAVAENPSFIGYLSRKPSHPKVKVLLQIN